MKNLPRLFSRTGIAAALFFACLAPEALAARERQRSAAGPRGGQAETSAKRERGNVERDATLTNPAGGTLDHSYRRTWDPSAGTGTVSSSPTSRPRTAPCSPSITSRAGTSPPSPPSWAGPPRSPASAPSAPANACAPSSKTRLRHENSPAIRRPP